MGSGRQRERNGGLARSWVIPHADDSFPIHSLDPRGEDRFLSFRNLDQIPLLLLEVYLRFAGETTFTGVAYRERQEDELWTPWTTGRNELAECNSVRDELAEGGAGLDVCRGEVGQELFSGSPVEVSECFEFLLKASMLQNGIW